MNIQLKFSCIYEIRSPDLLTPLSAAKAALHKKALTPARFQSYYDEILMDIPMCIPRDPHSSSIWNQFSGLWKIENAQIYDSNSHVFMKFEALTRSLLSARPLCHVLRMNDHSHSSPSLTSLLRITTRARHDRSHLFTSLTSCRLHMLPTIISLLLLGRRLHV